MGESTAEGEEEGGVDACLLLTGSLLLTGLVSGDGVPKASRFKGSKGSKSGDGECRFN